jgi:hypothetical protein
MVIALSLACSFIPPLIIHFLQGIYLQIIYIYIYIRKKTAMLFLNLLKSFIITFLLLLYLYYKSNMCDKGALSKY